MNPTGNHGRPSDDRVSPPGPKAVTFEGSGKIHIVGDVWGDDNDPVVLFLHGIGQTRHAWARVAKQIAREHWRCVLIDLRGHGESDWDPGHDYSLNAMAADCVSVIRQLGVPPVIVGASLGGLIGLYAEGTSKRPLASGLVLVDISLGTNHAAADRIRNFMLSGFDGFDSLEQAASAIAEYRQSPQTRAASSQGLRRVLRERDGRWYWHWDPALVRQFTMTNDSGRMGELRQTPLEPIGIPTLVLRGGKSDVITESGITELVQIAPDAEIIEIPDASHMIAGDQNDAFGTAVMAFLERRIRPRITT